MYDASTYYKAQIKESGHSLHVRCEVQFSDLTSLILYDTDIIEPEWLSITGGVTRPGQFDLGVPAMRTLKISLNNHTGNFDSKNFTDAVFYPEVGLLLTGLKNLFNRNYITVDYAVNTTTGAEYASSGDFVSNYTALSPSTAYVFSGSTSYQYAFYTSTNVYISGGTSASFTTPATCAFMRFSTAYSNLMNVQLEAGSTPTTYEDGANPEYIPCGAFTVDTPVGKGKILNVVAVDDMYKFERPYTDSTLTYPNTLAQIVAEACATCGVTWNSDSFPNNSVIVQTKPTGCTFRDVLGWVAEIAGQYCYIDRTQALRFGWYTLNWADEYAISWLRQYNVELSDFEISGIQYSPSYVSEDPTLYGTDTNSVILIENNKLLDISNDVAVLTALQTALVGYTFRPYNITTITDFALDFGDAVEITAPDASVYHTTISNYTHAIRGYSKLTGDAPSFMRNKTGVLSNEARARAVMLEQAQIELSTYEEMSLQASNAINTQRGYYETTVYGDDGRILEYYQHDAATLGASTRITKITSAGIAYSTNGGADYTTTVSASGITVPQLASRLIYADLITAGKLQSYDAKTFFDLEAGNIEIEAVIDSVSSTIKLNNTEGLAFYQGTTYRGGMKIIDGTLSLMTDVIGSIIEGSAYGKFGAVADYGGSGFPLSYFDFYTGLSGTATKYLSFYGYWQSTVDGDSLTTNIYTSQRTVDSYSALTIGVAPFTSGTYIGTDYSIYPDTTYGDHYSVYTAVSTSSYYATIHVYVNDNSANAVIQASTVFLDLYKSATEAYVKCGGDFIPSSSSNDDLGSSTLGWHALYLTGNAYSSGKGQFTGLSTGWGTTSGADTGAYNAVMGTATGATWLLSGSSGGTFRYGLQGLDSGGNLRLYIGTSYYLFDGSNIYAGATAFSKVGHTHSYLPLSGGTMTGAIVSATSYNFGATYGSTGLYIGNGDGATESTCNLDIQSWNGIGIKGMAGNPYGDGTRTAWINARTGRFDAKGGYYKNGTQASYEGHTHSTYALTSHTHYSTSLSATSGSLILNAKIQFNASSEVCYAPCLEGGGSIVLTAGNTGTGYYARLGMWNQVGGTISYYLGFKYWA